MYTHLQLVIRCMISFHFSHSSQQHGSWGSFMQYLKTQSQCMITYTRHRPHTQSRRSLNIRYIHHSCNEEATQTNLHIHVHVHLPAESMPPPTLHVPSRLKGQILSHGPRSFSPVCLLLPHLTTTIISLLGIILDANGIATVWVGTPANICRVIRELFHSQLHIVFKLLL